MSTGSLKSKSSFPSAGHPAGKVRVKLVDVAREAGVSPTTVSHALNDRGYVDQKTREAVKQVALRLGYKPNRHAQRLRTGEANMIVLISSMPFSVAGGPSRLGFLMEIAAVAAGIALDRGLALVLAPPSDTASRLFDQLDVDGVLALEPIADDSLVASFVDRGLPVVSIGRPPVLGLPYVDLHSATTTHQLLEHLHTQGSRRIALVIGKQQRTSYIEAIVAYQAFTAERGIKPVIHTVDELLGEEGGRLATLELIAQYPEMDAICAPVDAFAAGVIQALHDLGRQVPEDVMVATRYDGLRARNSRPPLTSLNLHLDTVAAQAIDLLLEHLRGETTCRGVDGPAAELIVRESTQRHGNAIAMSQTHHGA